MTEKVMHLYSYEGPVSSFGHIISDCWKKNTQAVSKAKALSNLKYNYKRDHELEPDFKIELFEKYLNDLTEDLG